MRRIGRLAGKRGMHAFIVGGMVRDILLGYPTTDLDITIEGDAVTVARDYAGAVGGRLRNVTRFGTCKVEGGPAGTVDFASTRTETYSRPGALPDVRICRDILLDLERRDFAINAMAVSLSAACYGLLLDPFDGWGDIEHGRLTVLHPCSFRDDPTRVLRGVRFAARYGYRFEKRTLALLDECLAAGCMRTISGKRVRRELDLIFEEDRAAAAVRLLHSRSILRAVDKGLDPDARHFKRLRAVDLAGRKFSGWVGAGFAPRLLWFGYLFTGRRASTAARLAERLDLDRAAKRISLWAARDAGGVARRLSGLKPSQAYEATRLLGPLPPEALALLYALSGRRERSMISTYMLRWRHVRPRLSGDDLIALGVRSGPAVGNMLDHILRLKLQGRLPTRRSEAAFVRREAGIVHSRT